VAASRIAAGYADIFSGGLFVSTSDGIGSADTPVPQLERFQLMRSRGRYVFTSGQEETSNMVMNVRSVDEYRALCVSRVDFIHIPNATHGNIDSRIFSRAMSYLDDPPAVDSAAQADCEKKLADRRAQGIAQVRQSLAAGDKDKAWGQLQDLVMAFGPLAEPEFSQLSACVSTGVTSTQACASGTP
jgi:hypothetical protein